MKLFVVVVFVQLALLGKLTGNEVEKLNITLFYESLCPYSQDFVQNQLYPGYQKLGHFLNVELVPYGNSHQSFQNGGWQFYCQHGPTECELNKLQACGLAKASSQDQQVEFANCVMELADGGETLSKCGTRVGLNPTVLSDCVSGVEGDQLLAQSGDKTTRHRYVPWLLINNKHEERMTRKASTNFVKTVCELLNKKPQECFK